MSTPPPTGPSPTPASAPGRVTLHIHLDKLQSNYRKIAAAVAPLQVMTVLKANAYGLGVRPVADALAAAGCWGFGCAELREALSLVELGKPVLILGGMLPDDIPQVLDHGILAPITDLDIARALNAAAAARGVQAECHCLIDSGMGRLGIRIEEAYETIRVVAALSHLRLTGLYSHFPSAYDDYEFSEMQISLVTQLLQRLEDDGITFQWRHIANSDGINNLPLSFQPPFNLVRTGINLYGVFDLEGKQTLALEPVLSMDTRLVAVRTLPAGATIGYGRTRKLERATRVGTIAMGYADGMPLGMSDRGYVMVHGRHCRILGRVSMDYTTICLDTVPQARVGDTVECLGKHITVGDWARYKQSIPYDIICSLGHRVARVYSAGVADSAAAPPAPH